MKSSQQRENLLSTQGEGVVILNSNLFVYYSNINIPFSVHSKIWYAIIQKFEEKTTNNRKNHSS